MKTEELIEISDAYGGLFVQSLVARCLGVTRARITQYIKAGRLMTFEIDGIPYIAGNSLAEFKRGKFPPQPLPR